METGHEKYGRVLDHLKVAFMKNVNFIVRESGRKRVVKEGVKNVHAFARGFLVSSNPHSLWSDYFNEITYNPFKGPNFYFKDTEEIVTSCKYLFLGQNGKCYGYSKNT